jgi:hypothetical protein
MITTNIHSILNKLMHCRQFWNILYRYINSIIFHILDSNTHETFFWQKETAKWMYFFKNSTGEFPFFSGPIGLLNRSGQIRFQLWEEVWSYTDLMVLRVISRLRIVWGVLLSISDAAAPTLFDVPCQLYYRVSSIWRSTEVTNNQWSDYPHVSCRK